MHLSLKNMS